MSAASQLSRRGLPAVGAATAALPLLAPSAAAARAAGRVRCAPCAFRNAEMVGGEAVAVSADGKRIVWSPAGVPVSWSDDHGATWTATKGLSAGATVRSDRVNTAKFYACHSGAFYLSTDGGKSFEVTAATGLPTAGNIGFKAAPGHEGDIWLAGGTTKPTAPAPYGLWRSTDSGTSFTKFEAVDEGDVVGFGKAALGAMCPAVYTSSRTRGVRGISRCDDAGRTWTRINDDRHQYGWTGNTMTGDPRVHGRVYFGTDGHGVVYGAPP
ncbi:hypothetical protein ACWDBW_47210 [Streptomyces sp. NPDC001107]